MSNSYYEDYSLSVVIVNMRDTLSIAKSSLLLETAFKTFSACVFLRPRCIDFLAEMMISVF